MIGLLIRCRPLWVVWCSFRRFLLVTYETLVVFYLMRRTRAGMLEPQHPWITGREPGTAREIWERNVVYRSPSTRYTPSDDLNAVVSVGRFMAAMVGKSSVEIPQGPKRRMPHAVNYIHGAVHYNGVYMLFDDFPDLVDHLTDASFVTDLLEFARKVGREVTFVMRDRDYDPLDFAYCVGCLRTHLPWFSNGNGPTKRPVLWGNASPYPTIGLINGAWMSDLFRLVRGDTASLVRPALSHGPYFSRAYRGRRREFSWLDRWVAWVIFVDVRLRGFRGQLFFTDRRVIEPRRVAEYRAAGGYWRWLGCHFVPPPFRARTKREVSDPSA